MESKARIIVSAETSMVDEKIKIYLSGLNPYDYVILKMDVTNGRGRSFLSFAKFQADATGSVDLSKDCSCGGTYKGINQMGLFWSLEPSQKFARKYPYYHHVKNVTKPLKFTLSLYNTDVTSIEDLNQLQSQDKLRELLLDSCVFERWYIKPKVKIIHQTCEEDGFIGTLYLPPGEGPHPGVIVMFSGVFEFKASLLASHGFAALALASLGPLHYFNDSKEDVPIGDLNYYKNAVDFMVGHPKVIPSGVGLLSNSFSGHLALLMAAHFNHIHCAICISGEVHNIGILYRLRDKTIHGSDYEFKKRFQHCLAREGIIDMYRAFPKMSLRELLRKEGFIPFYNKKDVAFMYIAGLDDEFLPAGHYADLFQNLMKTARHRKFEVHKYLGAGHLIDPPYSPLTKISRPYGKPVKWGGSSLHHAIAQEDSWKKQINFLYKNIVGCPKQNSESNNTARIKTWLTRSLTLVRKTFKKF